MGEQRRRAKEDARAKKSGHADLGGYRAIADALTAPVVFTGYNEVVSEGGAHRGRRGRGLRHRGPAGRDRARPHALLRGPKAWPSAMDAAMSLNDRVTGAQQEDRADDPEIQIDDRTPRGACRPASTDSLPKVPAVSKP